MLIGAPRNPNDQDAFFFTTGAPGSLASPTFALQVSFPSLGVRSQQPSHDARVSAKTLLCKLGCLTQHSLELMTVAIRKPVSGCCQRFFASATVTSRHPVLALLAAMYLLTSWCSIVSRSSLPERGFSPMNGWSTSITVVRGW
jgi:hypothetical protein